MQYLIVYASNPQYPSDSHWQVNGAGLKVSHWYGFGIIDGAVLVNRARHWITVPQRSNCTVNVTSQLQNQHTHFPKNSPLNINIEVSGCSIVYLEHVQAVTSMHIVNGMRKDISVYLTSPSGTKSTLLPYRPHDRHKDGFHLWPFMTVHSWGEKAHGKWVFSLTVRPGSQVRLQYLELILHGTKVMPESVHSLPSQCHPQCLGGCAKNGPEHCDVCRHYRLADTLACVERCPAGTYINKNMCRSCPPLCVACNNAHSCSQCQLQAFQLLNGSCTTECPYGTFATSANSCFTCNQSCLTCDGPTDNNCTSCHPQFVLQRHSCIMRESTSCPDGHYFDHRAHECRQCHVSCAKCSGKESTHCLSCLEGYKLDLNGQCTDSRHLRSCFSGEYFDSSTLSCLPCSSTCISCSSKLACTSCRHGYFLNQHSMCVGACLSQSATNSDCVNVTCHPSCLTCFGPEYFQCNSCHNNAVLLNHSCVEDCPIQFYKSNQICKACHDSCKTCNGSSQNDCLSCFPMRFLSLHQCVLECPAGTFGKDGVCSSCLSNCAGCMSHDSCENCFDGYLSLPVESGVMCVTDCPSDYVLHSPSRSCLHCPVNCANCSTTLSCLSCQSGYYYYAPSSSCLPACPDGYHSSLKGDCIACQPPCSTCYNSPFNCTTCSSGMALDTNSLTCQECCNPDRIQTRCCDCDQNDIMCVWSSLNNTATVSPTSNSLLAIRLGIGITIASLLVLLVVILLVLARLYYSKSSKRYHMLVSQEGLDIADDSGSDINLYDPENVVL